MLEQVSTAVTFFAFFVASKVGKTGLAVTVDVYRGSDNNATVTGGSATEVGGGLYKYTLSSGSTGTESEYLAIFKTSDTTVDAKHIPALWAVGRAGVENLDATVNSRATQASVDTIDDFLDTEIAAIKTRTDLIPNSPAAVGDAMTLATNAVSAAALAADAVAEIVAGILAGTVDGLTLTVLLKTVLAACCNVATPSGSSVAFKARDGSTTVLTITYGASDGERTASVIP